MEKEFNPQESLQLIQGMINKAQNRFAENGFLYLLWGWVVLIAALFQYLVLKFNIDWIKHSEYVWFSTIFAGVYQVYYLSKREKVKVAETYTDDLIKYCWIVYGISMMLVSVIIGYTKTWETMYPIIFVIYGIPTFLSGAIMKFTPLKVGAICCWIIAFSAVFISINYLLLLSIAMITTWIIPGYFLQAKYNKEYKRN